MNYSSFGQQITFPANIVQMPSNGSNSCNVLLTVYPQTYYLNLQNSWPFEGCHMCIHQTSNPQAEPLSNPVAIEEERPPINAGSKSRKQCLEKELESAKKNSESNLVNQLLAFLNNTQVSQKLVNSAIRRVKRKGCSEQKIRVIFYNVVRLLNLKRGRKYVNRHTLMQYYTPESFLEYVPKIKEACSEPDSLSLEDLCRLFRMITYTFLKENSVISVLTSRRISSVARLDHLRRRRKVVKALANLDQFE